MFLLNISTLINMILMLFVGIKASYSGSGYSSRPKGVQSDDDYFGKSFWIKVLIFTGIVAVIAILNKLGVFDGIKEWLKDAILNYKRESIKTTTYNIEKLSRELEQGIKKKSRMHFDDLMQLVDTKNQIKTKINDLQNAVKDFKKTEDLTSADYELIKKADKAVKTGEKALESWEYFTNNSKDHIVKVLLKQGEEKIKKLSNKLDEAVKILFDQINEYESIELTKIGEEILKNSENQIQETSTQLTRLITTCEEFYNFSLLSFREAILQAKIAQLNAIEVQLNLYKYLHKIENERKKLILCELNLFNFMML